jgi:hypothetical protein
MSMPQQMRSVCSAATPLPAAHCLGFAFPQCAIGRAVEIANNADLQIRASSLKTRRESDAVESLRSNMARRLQKPFVNPKGPGTRFTPWLRIGPSLNWIRWGARSGDLLRADRHPQSNNACWRDSVHRPCTRFVCFQTQPDVIVSLFRPFSDHRTNAECDLIPIVDPIAHEHTRRRCR